MRKSLLALSVFLLSILYGRPANGQSAYWQQQVNYSIDVSLNDKLHTIDGFEKMEYINHSPDTLRFIWFHLWPNAFKNDKTAFSNQLLEYGNTRFYFSSREEKGYINRLDFKVNDITAATEDHPQHIDIIKVLLPTPLPPGGTALITTPFHVKLPFNFSRGGHDGQSYQVTQWYPKPAVYDSRGWHPMPYLDHGEFYSEFGNYDVRITVPENYVVAATGELQNAAEKEWLAGRSGYTWKPVKWKEKKGGAIHTVTEHYPPTSPEIKTLRFVQDRVHDFAWFADKRFIVAHDTCRLGSGKIVDIYSYYTPDQKKSWTNSVSFARSAIRFHSESIGEYPFSVISIVQGPASSSGGMEYPTITLVAPETNERLLEFTISHEIGHNWFYAALGSDERRYPWMDEGLNTYYDNRYRQWRYGEQGEIPFGKKSISIENTERLFFETQAIQKKDQPINTSSDSLSPVNYGLVAYYKTGAWLQHLQTRLGKETFDKAMREYYRQWQFRHPSPADFKSVMEESSGQNLDSLFLLTEERGLLPGQHAAGSQTAFIFSPGSLRKYIAHPSRNLLLFGPSFGFNFYDRIMVGGLFTNYKLPPSKFQFFLAPMYAPTTKKFTGTGLIHYTFYPGTGSERLTVGVSASTFTIDKFTDAEGNKNYFSFYKIVPSARFVFGERHPGSHLQKYIQFKTFMIGEDELRFYRDTLIDGSDTAITDKYRTLARTRTLNQLKMVVENNRALYPYRGELNIEQGKGFVRTQFTGKYFFNYVKEGGLDLRLFAGKFSYTHSKVSTLEMDRYHLNMTGPNGAEDYTYRDYFVGRNEFEGVSSQQIMIRDGGFKVRTDLLGDKIGKTDDWLIAANLSSSIPSSVNPLSILPVKIPLKFFVDIGTNAEAWKKDTDQDRFLFDAGIQIPLFQETINIYVPLLYSRVYKDYFRSTLQKKDRFFKTISFSIDISGFNLRKFNRSFTD